MTKTSKKFYCLSCGKYDKLDIYYIPNIPKKIGKRERCAQCGTTLLSNFSEVKPKQHKVLTFNEYMNIDIRTKYNIK